KKGCCRLLRNNPIANSFNLLRPRKPRNVRNPPIGQAHHPFREFHIQPLLALFVNERRSGGWSKLFTPPLDCLRVSSIRRFAFGFPGDDNIFTKIAHTAAPWAIKVAAMELLFALVASPNLTMIHGVRCR